MPNPFFQFKQFLIRQDRCAMKVTTDGCLFGAWVGDVVGSRESEVGSREGRDRINVSRILEVGTGTGVLALMIAQKTGATIDTIEIDREAYEQAKVNFSSSPFQERINIFHADAKAFQFDGEYDFIVSNPPFYDNELKSPDLRKNLAHHEGLALPDLLALVSAHLKSSGKFFLLLPFKRLTELPGLFAASNLIASEIVTLKQSSQHEPIRVFIRGCHQKNGETNYRRSEITIKNENQQYTPAFINLLRDYYLYL